MKPHDEPSFRSSPETIQDQASLERGVRLILRLFAEGRLVYLSRDWTIPKEQFDVEAIAEWIGIVRFGEEVSS